MPEKSYVAMGKRDWRLFHLFRVESEGPGYLEGKRECSGMRSCRIPSRATTTRKAAAAELLTFTPDGVCPRCRETATRWAKAD